MFRKCNIVIIKLENKELLSSMQNTLKFSSSISSGFLKYELIKTQNINKQSNLQKTCIYIKKNIKIKKNEIRNTMKS